MALGSTSDEAITRAGAGAKEGLAIQALRQDAGRGSRGREWVAPEGNLNLSVLLRPKKFAAASGLFALMAGVAVAQALGPDLTLKWPNDILLGGVKLGGILIDTAAEDDRLAWLVIGIGVNLAEAPEIPGRAATSLKAKGRILSPQQAANLVLEALSAWHDAPPQAIITSWLKTAHPVGTPITVQAANGSKHGIFAGLSPQGELLLQSGMGIETISTGDILLGAA